MKLKKFFSSLIIGLLSFTTAACGSNGSSKEFVDYAHNGSIQLSLDYKGKSFWTDGVEQVTFKTHIDGDTVHFNTSTGVILKSRFYGIDTPESTGKIQEYGYEASKFTQAKIAAAAKNGTIVISSPQHEYAAPQADTTGSRYLSMVWISEDKKDCPFKELVLLNLYIVQEGYSWVKNVAAFPEYADVFYKAEDQAKAFKLNLHSGEPAEHFNYGEFQDVSLLDIKNEVVANLTDSNHANAFDNAKCRVQGTVAGYVDHVLYIVNHFTEDDTKVAGTDEYAGLNIFTGMGSIPSRFYQVGAYIQVCGYCVDSENFGFQMSGANFPNVTYSDNDATVLFKADETPEERKLKVFDFTANEFQTMIDKKDFSKIYLPVNCTTSLTCSKAYKSTDGDFTLSFSGTSLQAYITFPYESGGVVFTNESDYVGKTFNVSGIYVPHTTTSGNQKFQINPITSESLVVVG